MPFFLMTTVFLAALWIPYASLAQTGLINDHVSFIASLFDEYKIVAIGERHDNQDLHDLYLTLIRDERIQDRVDDIVLEYGNSLYQDILDRYVYGDDVEFEQVQRVWRNVFVSQMLQYGVDSFAEMVQIVRRINVTLPDKKKIRILAGGVPFDWEKPDLKNRFNAFFRANPRDPHYARIVLSEVLDRNRKALLISGSVHLKKTSTVPVMIEQQYPNSVYSILSATAFGSQADQVRSFLKTAPAQPYMINLNESPVGMIEASSVSATDGNIGLRKLPEGVAIRNNDIIVSREEDGSSTVEHVFNGKPVVVFRNGRQVAESSLRPGPNGNVQGAGLPEAGHYRHALADEGLKLRDITDAVILIDRDRRHPAPDGLWEDDAFWDELNRRNVILYAIPIDPSIRATRGASDHAHH